MEVNNKSSVLEKYCIERVSSEEAEKLEKNMTGWRVLCNLGQKNMNNLSSFNFFKTNNKAWVSEFYFTAVTIINQRVLLVSPECPEYLFIDPSDLVDVVREYEVELNEGVMKLFDDLRLLKYNPTVDETYYTTISSDTTGNLFMDPAGKLYYCDGTDENNITMRNLSLTSDGRN